MSDRDECELERKQRKVYKVRYPYLIYPTSVGRGYGRELHSPYLISMSRPSHIALMIPGGIDMHYAKIRVKDVSIDKEPWAAEIPLTVVHWMKQNTISDLKALFLEMHSNGEDITNIVQLVSDLEDAYRKVRYSGYLPEQKEYLEEINHVEEEIEEVLA